VQQRTVEPEHIGALADAQVVDDLWSQFEAQGVAGQHLVDAAARSPEAIAHEIFEGCVAGRFAL
jgi:hypothetical protein